MSMMFTRSAARAFLAKRVVIDNDKLPDDVLLEIFDAYRRLYELQPDHENVWNSRDGWFKLAHVCLRWRRVVLSSSSRLHVYLLFTPRRSSTAVVLRRLPPLPILVDYCVKTWTKKGEHLLLAALRQRSRVRGIVLQTPYTDAAKLLRVLNHPFPELESLEIRPSYPYDSNCELIPATFLSGSAPSLRRLTLQDGIPRCLSSLLSSATGLVELALALKSSPPVASLLTNLQRMSCLRRLELNVYYQPGTKYFDTDSPPSAGPGDVVPLSNLTDLIFTGHRLYLKALVVGLAAPSLQRLDAELCGHSLRFSPIPHLCKFICGTGCQLTMNSHSRACLVGADGPRALRAVVHRQGTRHHMGCRSVGHRRPRSNGSMAWIFLPCPASESGSRTN
ncbi:hypothetical protein BJY52DRAFT_819785 [Lactarius psammicola]|nr:hypothetical protein BJY52DRAFT_819785 [Lactarius psammicola]